MIERAFKASRPGRQRTVAATAPTKENQTYCSKLVEPGDADGDREGGPAQQMETMSKPDREQAQELVDGLDHEPSPRGLIIGMKRKVDLLLRLAEHPIEQDLHGPNAIPGATRLSLMIARSIEAPSTSESVTST